MPSDLYEHFKFYSKAETEFEKKLAAERLSKYFEKTKVSPLPRDRCKAAAVAEILGRCHFQFQNHHDAEFYFLESISQFRSLGLEVKAAQVAVQLAMFYLSQNRQTEAQEMLEYYEKQQVVHFGEGHFQSVNASEMRVIVLEKRDTVIEPVAVAPPAVSIAS